MIARTKRRRREKTQIRRRKSKTATRIRKPL